jgi:hypothetical protein
MRVEIEIPTKDQTISEAYHVAIAGKGAPWKESCLGEKARDSGVYVIHHGGDIKYVGKTNGPAMSFGIRLRREFQESASGGKHIYPKLVSLTTPPPILVSLFPSATVEKLVRVSGIKLGSHQIIEIFETVLIQAYQPEFQRHHEKRTVAYLKKLGYPRAEDVIAILKKNSG